MPEYKYKVVSRKGGSCTVQSSSPFYLEYKKGERIKALDGSLGIMVFPTKQLAISFLYGILGWTEISRIKRVIPIGKATFPERVSGTLSSRSLRRFNREIAQGCVVTCCYKPPEGTVCYPEVLVVD